MGNSGRMLIASAGILYGTVTVGANLLTRRGIPVLGITITFLGFSLIPLLPFVIRRGLLERIKSSSKYLFYYGVVGTFLVFAQFISLSFGVPPAIVALLLYTQPVWTVLFGRAFFSEAINKMRIIIIMLALAGALLVSDPFSSIRTLGAGSGTLAGESIALVGGVFLSLWIILGKRGRLDNFQDPVELTFVARGSTSVFIAFISMGVLISGRADLFGNPFTIYSNISYLFAFAIIAGLLPDYLFYKGVETVSSIQAGVILLLEPISAALLSVLLMISSLGPLELIGAGLILVSNYFVVRSD